MELSDQLFKVFNVDGTKNGEVTQFVLLEVEINGYEEKINTAVMNLNNIDISNMVFLSMLLLIEI